MIQHAHLSQDLSEQELHFYSRQLLLDEWDFESQQKLKNSRVLIVGAGGIGCTAALLLARSGVGTISIIDPDIIEISNLQRQMGFQLTDVGQAKSTILAHQMKQINPYIQVNAFVEKLDVDNADELISHHDLVLDGCDQFATRYLVNETCVQHQVPLISASAIGLTGQMLMVAQNSACYACLFPKDHANDEELRCADSGVLSTTPNVIASLQAHHALLYLGLGLTPLLGKFLVWNAQSMQQRILKFEKEPDCPCCQT